MCLSAPCVEKFNLASNDHGGLQKCNFSVLDLKFSFWAKLVQKIKIASFGTWVNLSIQNCKVMFNFSIFNWKCPFWVNLVQKLKIVNLGWNLAPRLIKICRIHWWIHLLRFRQEIPFLRKFGPKNESCQFKLKFCTLTKSDLKKSMVMFIFSFFNQKYPF